MSKSQNKSKQVRSSAWLIGFYAVTILLSKLGSFGGIGVLSHPFDTVAVAVCALGIYYWGAATGVPAHLVRLEHEDDESEAVSEPQHNAPLSPATH